MSVNSSSSSNVSLPPLSSPAIVSDQLQLCLMSTIGAFSINTLTITSLLILLPLFIFVLYLGFQQWRQHSSKSTSHSDVFTFHMVVMELMSVFGSILTSCAVHTDLTQMLIVGIYIFSLSLSGQLSFHMLTCVERYLAVVHPITYLSLKETNGIRLRNAIIGCVWLLSVVEACEIFAADKDPIIKFYIFAMTFTITVVSFCSLSVLCVLIRPGPGGEGGGRQRVDQSKLKAFYTIMAILGVLLLRIGGNIVTSFLSDSPLLGKDERCALLLSIFWFCLPSRLVLPLLFLQRAGKLLCCKKNNKAGQGPD